MSTTAKVVNGFYFMPPSLAAWIGKTIPQNEFDGPIPWTPLNKPLSETVFSLMTTAGISMKEDTVFDMEREKREPLWGDPTYRKIEKSATAMDIRSEERR